MADLGKMWFEMGVRDNVTQGVNIALNKMKEFHGEIDKVNRELENWAVLGKDFSQKDIFGQQAMRNAMDYQKSIYEVRKEMDKLFSLRRDTKALKLDTNGVDDAIKVLYTEYRRLQNMIANGDNDIDRGRLVAFRQQLSMTLTQIRDFYRTQVNENKAAEKAVRDNEKANKDMLSTLDKLKSKQYDLSNLRNSLRSAMNDAAAAGVDITNARNILGRLWSKQKEVSNLIANGQPIPDNFFGADYKELIRQAKEVYRTLNNQTVEAQRNAARSAIELGKANEHLVSTYDNIISRSKSANSVLRQMEIQIASTFSLYSAEHLLKSVIQIGGEFEQQHIALQNILGDVEEANTLFNQIQTLAVVSPFNFRQLTSYTKQTAAYGIPYEELYDTTKRLADLSAGLGVDMGRLILAYGQVRSASVLRGQELRQFTEAGIPLVQKLADKFTELNGRVVTTGEVFELISKRKVPFEMVKEILWDMTNAGGSFYQMQFKLSDTLLGKWSNLQDAWEIMLSKFAEGGSTGGDTLKWLVQGATDLIESLDRLSPVLTGVIGGVGISKLTNLATGNILNTEKAILDAKKIEASRLRRDALTRSLSAREQEILNTSNKITANDIKALASSGRLNTLKLQQLYVSKQLSLTDVARLVNEKAITVEQGAQIANATKLKVVLGSLKATAGGIMSGVVSMVTNPAFLMTAGISAALALYMTWKDAENERKEIAESVGNTILDQYNQVLKVQQDISKSNPSTDGEYLKGINEMTETLKSVGAYSGDIENQAISIENLGERYDYLKKKIDEVAVAYENLSRHAQTSTEYAISQTDGWFDESIVTNMKDLTDSLEGFDKAAIGIQRYGSIIQTEIDKFASFAGNESLKKQLDGKSVEEQLKIIAKSGYWRNIQNLVGQTSSKAREALADFNNAYFEVLADWNTITGEDLPAFIQGIEDTFKREHPDIDLTNLDDKMKLELKRFVHQALTEVDGVRQDIKDRLEQDIDAHFNINVDFSLSIATPPDYWRVKYPILNQLFGKLNEKGINMDNSFYESIGEAGGASSSDKLWKYMDSQVDDLKRQWQSEEKLYGEASEQAIKAKDAYENMQKSRDAAFGGSMKDLNKNNTKGGSKKDVELEHWKEEWSELKSFYSEFKKWAKEIGDDEALSRLRKTGLWGQFFDKDGNAVYDMKSWEKAIEQFESKLSGGSTARDKFIFDVGKEKLTPQYDRVKELAEALFKQLEEELKKQGKQWDLYKKILDATGSKEQASTIAFGGSIRFDNYAEQLRDEIGKALEKNEKAKGYSIDQLLGMDDAALRNLDIFKNSADGVYSRLKMLEEMEQQLKSEDVELFLEAIKGAKSLETELDQIKVKYDRLRNAVAGNENLSPEKRQELTTNLNNEQAEKEADKRWEWFKKDNADWGRVFGNLDKMSTNTLISMRDKLEGLAPSLSESVEATKALYEAIEKIDNVVNKRNPFAAMTDALKVSSAIKDLRKKGFNDYGFRNTNGTYTINANKARKLGLTVKEDGEYTDEELDDATKGAIQEFNDGLGGLSTKFKAVQDALTPVIGLFDALGEEGLSKFFSMGSNALGAAVQMGQGAASLFGAAAGPWGAAAGAALSVISSVVAMHDESLQKEIEASQARQKEMESLTKNLETVLSRTLGGIYSTTSSNDALSSLRKERESVMVSPSSISDMIIYAERYNYLGKDTLEAMDNAEKTKKYYDAVYASLLAQRDELQHQMEMEEDKKGSDSDKLSDYRQQLVEMEDEIKYFAQDMAKALWDIDVKSWAKDLTSTIVDAWKNGENAVDAYKNKVKEMMLDLTTNILSQKVMEKMLEKAGLDTLIENLMIGSGGELNADSVAAIAETLNSVGEESANVITSILDSMEKRGYISKGEESGTSSASSSIKGVTEQTADLLASYINAIRADVSINRMTLTQILQVVQSQSQMPVIAREQLRQLELIVANTGRNAALVEEIRDVLNGNINGSNKFRIK